MKVHHEGRGILITLFLALAAINAGLFFSFKKCTLTYVVLVVSSILFLLVLNFFRSPHRRFNGNHEDSVVAPADGKIVAIEEVFEPEYFKEKRLLVSVFMSVFNVHANWYPVSGVVKMNKHHNGRFVAAWLPKSSTENERSTVVIERVNGTEVLVRQIAGAMARRIVTYPEIGDEAHIDEHFGFIKFGSRVDVYLPIGTKILVEMDQKVTGNQTLIAELPIDKA
ncbi:phosphatidylserine decarboxylase family protein [Dysgonomonas sp. 216]|uniref:phosphatidylserine decarboxylase family protein n=1 Tax=Dysgonomonas sp. 216 TaxID=2302934 RepID=UPI0013D1183C|nr:phosphatidylserine decarboxylase family protein [Dysgonomonas sp. 216]NDW17463.1 phosphatidylserine decarboxylase family protein [Dysgonomonas sp. 216]